MLSRWMFDVHHCEPARERERRRKINYAIAAVLENLFFFLLVKKFRFHTKKAHAESENWTIQ
jgi:hypothetical protein